MIPYQEIRELAEQCDHINMSASIQDTAKKLIRWLRTEADFRELPGHNVLRLHTKWEDQEGDVVVFSADGTLGQWDDPEIRRQPEALARANFVYGGNLFKPHGKTWAEVESLAAEVSP